MAEQNPYRQDDPQEQGGPSAGEDDLFVAEPGTYDQYDEPEPPAWPKTVGVIGIVVGAISLCCGVLGAGSLFFQKQMIAGAIAPPYPPSIDSPSPVFLALTVVSLLWNIYLIVASAMLVARKHASRSLLLIYAVGALAIGTISIYFSVQTQLDMQEWMRNNPDTEFAQTQQMGGGGTIGMIIGLIVGAVIAYAWPIFLLIWLGLVKRSADDMGTAEDTV
jgi:hypothetical protein